MAFDYEKYKRKKKKEKVLCNISDSDVVKKPIFLSRKRKRNTLEGGNFEEYYFADNGKD